MLVQVLIAVAVIGVSIMAILGALHHARQVQARANTMLLLGSFRQGIVTLLVDQRSWLATINGARNGSMACLVNGTSCDDTTPRLFALYNAANTIVFDSTDPGSGLTADGRACSTYSDSGNDACPFRFELNWSPVCEPPACVQPLVRVSANLKYSPGTRRMVFNPANFDVPAMMRPPNPPPLPGGVCTTSGVLTPPTSLQASEMECAAFCSAGGFTACRTRWSNFWSFYQCKCV